MGLDWLKEGRFSILRPTMLPGRFLYHLGVLAGGLILIGSLLAIRVSEPFLVREARVTTADLLQRTSPRPYIDAPVKIVDIDERSLSLLGQWPWPRDRVAELVDRLHAAGAAAVAFDFLFVEPDRMSPSRLLSDPAVRARLGLDGHGSSSDLADNDKIMAEALRRGNVVLGFGTSEQRREHPQVKAGFAYTGEDPAPYVIRLRGGAWLLPTLADAAAGIGSVNLSTEDAADSVRAVPIVWSDGKRLYPSLIGEALRVAQGAQTYVINADQATGGVQSVRIGAFEVPTGPTGEFNLYYTPPRPDRYVSAADIFDDDRLRALAPDLAGRIVFIGTSAAGLFDLHKTSLGYTAPGVEMHAQAVEQIINGQFLLKKEWTNAVEYIALLLGSVIVGLTTIYGGARIAFFLGAAIASLIAFGSWYAFRYLGVLIDFSFPLVAGITVWFAATAFRYIVTDKEKRGIRNAFSRYVHPSVLKDIERNYSQVQLGGENCELTVLFTDIRNFTTLSERLTPAELVAFLNQLLGALGKEIVVEGGVIDKFIGDSIMAFWNAPLRQRDHAARACAAALQMRNVVRHMNDEKLFGLPPHVAREARIEIGVGINTGAACVGNVGSSDRFNYSAIGDAVNVASRAESACKEVGYDLVVGRSTASQAPGFAFLEAGAVQLKGKTERVQLMILIGDRDLAASSRFQVFEQHYRNALELLAGQRVGLESALAECRKLAAEIDLKLVRYLQLLAERREDFMLPTGPDVEMVATG